MINEDERPEATGVFGRYLRETNDASSDEEEALLATRTLRTACPGAWDVDGAPVLLAPLANNVRDDIPHYSLATDDQPACQYGDDDEAGQLRTTSRSTAPTLMLTEDGEDHSSVLLGPLFVQRAANPARGGFLDELCSTSEGPARVNDDSTALLHPAPQEQDYSYSPKAQESPAVRKGSDDAEHGSPEFRCEQDQDEMEDAVSSDSCPEQALQEKLLSSKKKRCPGLSVSALSMSGVVPQNGFNAGGRQNKGKYGGLGGAQDPTDSEHVEEDFEDADEDHGILFIKWPRGSAQAVL